ncbi:adenosylcobinamide-phosphate synthase CbiB [Hydrogenoanaerobacterium sp.]|uniref:adenosylcobinamide-phosphate synthase CbiB n=1 Tax=Hydrogenoanaerobacterium sp. TaxID=2953763 RepID=UPI00289A30D2|nr:adenosylcobinamide-phosphate synthase CbiB [Hydrogenoanaerobacterium sp.]
MTLSLIALCFGFVLDLIFGDPHWLPHPVRWIGILIEKTEGFIRRRIGSNESSLRRGGTTTVLTVLVVTTLVPLGILAAANAISPYLRLALETLMCYQILATKSLKTESMKVYAELKKGDLAAARTAVSMIVGRDTAELTGIQVAKATVETVAENTSDGIVAPLLFLAIGGAPLGFFYKGINTMDSMLGYKNERYLHFGWFAARLDDAVNYIPARLSACFMIAAAFVLRFDTKNAVKVFQRDRYNHASPNSAQTESVCAGALRIQLAGDAYYFGKLCHKPTIGDALRPVSYEDIPAANRLMYGAAVIALAVCTALKLAAICLL